MSEPGAGDDNGSMASTVTKYYSGKLYRQLLGGLTTYLRPLLLSPTYYGVWTLLKLIPNYASYAHMGTRSAVRYLIPRYEARGDDESLGSLRDSAFWFGLAVNVLVAIGVGAAALMPVFTPAVRWGLVAVAFIIVLRYYHHFLISLLEAHEQFGVVTVSIYLFVTLTFVTTIPLLLLFEIYGLYISVLIGEIGTVTYLRAKYHFVTEGRFDWGAVRQLLASGFPIIVLNLSVVLISTCDRIIVASMLGKEPLGYYGIAAMGLAFLVNMPGTARAVMEPRLMRTVEGRAVQETVDDYVVKPLLKVAFLMPFVIGPSFLGIPLGIRLLLPRYVPGVAAAQTLAVGSLFLGLAYIPRMMIVARNWQLRTCWLLPPVLFFNVVLGVYLVQTGHGLFGVALSSIISFFLLFLVMFWLLWSELGEALRCRRMTLLAMAAPVALMLGLLLVLSYGVLAPIENEFLGTGLAVVAYGVAYWLFYHAACRRLAELRPIRVGNFL